MSTYIQTLKKGDDQILPRTSASAVSTAAGTSVEAALASKSSVSVSASGTATDTVSYITVDGVEKKLAGGGGSDDKTTTYPISTVDNPDFASNNTSIATTSFTDTSGVSHLVSELQKGDIIRITDNNYPDRFVYENSGGGLPEGYTQLEYIQSDATQYILTGMAKGTNWTNKLTNIIDGYFIIPYGCVGGTDRGGQLASSNTGYWSCERSTSTVSCTVRTTIKQILDMATSTDTLYLGADGTQSICSREATISEWAYSYPLFRASDAGSYTYMPSSFRLYSFIMYADDVLARNFIPAMRDSDSEVGLWDTVTETFFTRANGGNAFTYAIRPEGRVLTAIHAAAPSNINASTITSGTLDNNRLAIIPNTKIAVLPASQITSGVFAAARVAGITYTTTAPTTANTDGVKLAILSSAPATKYDGWLYFIAGA